MNRKSRGQSPALSEESGEQGSESDLSGKKPAEMEFPSGNSDRPFGPWHHCSVALT